MNTLFTSTLEAFHDYRLSRMTRGGMFITRTTKPRVEAPRKFDLTAFLRRGVLPAVLVGNAAAGAISIDRPTTSTVFQCSGIEQSPAQIFPQKSYWAAPETRAQSWVDHFQVASRTVFPKVQFDPSAELATASRTTVSERETFDMSNVVSSDDIPKIDRRYSSTDRGPQLEAEGRMTRIATALARRGLRDFVAYLDDEGELSLDAGEFGQSLSLMLEADRTTAIYRRNPGSARQAQIFSLGIMPKDSEIERIIRLYRNEVSWRKHTKVQS